MQTPAALPPIDNENWIVRCATAEERDALLAYAVSKGVPCESYTPDEYLPSELSIGWCIDMVLAYGGTPDMGNHTPAQLIAMCDAYAAPRHTAPAAPHGVRDLGLGIVAALALCGLLNLTSCATQPATAPLVSAPHHTQHDSRTKLVEPGPSHIK